ncbi:hypothetical protein [Phyllobacterium sp. OV277]|uniref:hypothetical protein n=1 Tax=Phyllobacterium sp. OV277 TaxID=1882772 RepID=UPI0008904D82|nr:hypothetical protein SAMN05443582_11545 [Phyllobacterium sp. OV277]
MVFDVLLKAAIWFLVAFCGGQVLIFMSLVLWTIWKDTIEPRLIPASEIDSVAEAIIANHCDPEAEAFARHQRAWRRCDGAEQTYWYRVRKAVRRFLAGNY